MTLPEMKADVYDLIVRRGQQQQELDRLTNEINQKAQAITELEAKERAEAK